MTSIAITSIASMFVEFAQNYTISKPWVCLPCMSFWLSVLFLIAGKIVIGELNPPAYFLPLFCYFFGRLAR